MGHSTSGWVVTGALALLACGGQSIPTDAERTGHFDKLEVEQGIKANVLIADGHAFKTDERSAIDADLVGDRLILRNRANRQEVAVTVFTEELTSLRLSGKSEVSLENLDSQRVELQMSGQSLAHLSGDTDSLQAHLSGQAHLEAMELTARNAEVEASGDARCTLSVSGRLQAQLAGNAHCDFGGDPEERDVQTDGEATVSFP